MQELIRFTPITIPMLSRHNMIQGPRTPETRRLWCIPPAMLRGTNETLDASPILEEFDGADADLGVFLWQAVRDAIVWADTAPEERQGLFGPRGFEWRCALLTSSPADTHIRPAIQQLLDLVDRPGSVDTGALSRVYLHLARWAHDRSALRSAVWFAQAAAVVVPEDGAAALEAGSLAAVARDDVRAEAWLRRAIGVSRRAGDWASYTRAFVERGTLAATRGDDAQARRLYLRALRTARRKSLRECRALAAHALVPLLARAGEFDAADRAGRIARLGYGAEHVRTPALMRDLARMWVECGTPGRARAALPRLLLRHMSPQDRMQLLALTGRALAGTGPARTTQFMDAFLGAFDLAQHCTNKLARDQALSDLALAALAARDPRLVERVAQAANVPFSFQADIEEQVNQVVGALADHSRRAGLQ